MEHKKRTEPIDKALIAQYILNLGQRIKKLRIEKGYTITTFALDAELKPKQLVGIEEGTVNLKLPAAQKIALILDTSLAELLKEG